MNAVFTAAVWPQIEKLPLDGVSHPTGLLILLHTWTKYTRYWPLLGKHSQDKAHISPLPFVFRLLHSNGLNDNVSKMVMSMVENLLTVEEDNDEEHEDMEVETEEVQPIEVTEMVKLEANNGK